LMVWMAWVIFYFHRDGYQSPLNIHRLLAVDTLFCLAGMIPGPLTYGHWIQFVTFPLLLTAGIYRMWRSYREKLLEWMLLWILPVLMITLFIRLTLSFIGYRYGLGVFPLTALVIALGSGVTAGQSNCSPLLFSGKSRFFLQFLFIAYLLAGFGRLAFAGPDYFTHQDWKKVGTYLQREAAPQDFIWVSSEGFSFPARFYDPLQRLNNYVWPAKGNTDADKVRSLERLGHLAKAKQCKAWIVMADFHNAIPWIDWKTRSSEKNPDKSNLAILAGLAQSAHYRAVPVQTYKRIRILLLNEKR
jgi:hypothetical protein